ncbi:MAG TPA: FecR domain-containing protein [Clostridia bacterium]|nr:FecR domain-containing protein [Clostridia bacterium]
MKSRAVKRCLILLLLIVFVFTNMMPLYAENNLRVAKIAKLSGDVTVMKSGGEKSFPAFKNMGLLQGDKLVTGADGAVTLELDSDKEVVISKNTQLVLSELMTALKGSSGSTTLNLLGGQVMVNVKKKLDGDSKFEIKTPTAVMGVRGTRFFVGYSGGVTEVAVFEGNVRVASYRLEEQPDGTVRQVPAELSLSENQQTSFDSGAIQEGQPELQEVTAEELPLFVLETLQQDPQGIKQEILENIEQIIEQKRIEEQQAPPPPPPPPPSIILDNQQPPQQQQQQQQPTPPPPPPPPPSRDDDDDGPQQVIPVSSVTLNKSTLTFNGLNASHRLTAAVSPANATNQAITWTSGNTGVAVVDSSGNVTSKGWGTTEIYSASASNPSVKAVCKVTVARSVEIKSARITNIYRSSNPLINNVDAELVSGIWSFGALTDHDEFESGAALSLMLQIGPDAAGKDLSVEFERLVNGEQASVTIDKQKNINIDSIGKALVNLPIHLGSVGAVGDIVTFRLKNLSVDSKPAVMNNNELFYSVEAVSDVDDRVLDRGDMFPVDAFTAVAGRDFSFEAVLNNLNGDPVTNLELEDFSLACTGAYGNISISEARHDGEYDPELEGHYKVTGKYTVPVPMGAHEEIEISVYINGVELKEDTITAYVIDVRQDEDNSDILITNDLGSNDTIVVNDLSEGFTVNLYTDLYYEEEEPSDLIASYTVPAGKNTAVFHSLDLGSESGSIWIGFDHPYQNYLESKRIEFDYEAESGENYDGPVDIEYSHIDGDIGTVYSDSDFTLTLRPFTSMNGGVFPNLSLEAEDFTLLLVNGTGSLTKKSVTNNYDGTYTVIANYSNAEEITVGARISSGEIWVSRAKMTVTPETAEPSDDTELSIDPEYTSIVSADNTLHKISINESITVGDLLQALLVGGGSGTLKIYADTSKSYEVTYAGEPVTGAMVAEAIAQDGTTKATYTIQLSQSSSSTIIQVRAGYEELINVDLYSTTISVINGTSLRTLKEGLIVGNGAGSFKLYSDAELTFPVINDSAVVTKSMSLKAVAQDTMTNEIYGIIVKTPAPHTNIAVKNINYASLATDNTLGNNYSGSGETSGDISISGDGRYVAFRSSATNLVAGDTNGTDDIFVRDRDTDEDEIFDEPGCVKTVRVSVTSSGAQVNRMSKSPYLSKDGRYVTFASYASNLVAGDTNSIYDIFVHDRDTDKDGVFDESGAVATVRVSLNSDGTQVSGIYNNTFISYPSISEDGRYVTYYSNASSIVSNDTNSGYDIFLHDRDADEDNIFDEDGAVETRRVSQSPEGSQIYGASYFPRISGDGRFVAFSTGLLNESGTVDNSTYGIYVYNVETRSSARLAVGSDPDFSEDGRYMVFSSSTDPATGIKTVGFDYSGNLGTVSEIYVLDRDSDGDGIYDETDGNAIYQASVNNNWEIANYSCSEPVISSNGRIVSFYTKANNLAGVDSNGENDIYVRDIFKNTTKCISRTNTGITGDSESFIPAINYDGSQIAYVSYAENLSSTVDEFNKPDVLVSSLNLNAEPDTIAPYAPTGIRLEEVGPTWMKIAWDAGTDNIAVVKYKIQIFGPNLPLNVFKTEVDGETLSSWIDGLIPDSNYEVEINSIDEDGNISEVFPTVLTTAPDPALEQQHKPIAAGKYYSLKTKADGSVWAWGENSRGQLGNNSSTDSSVPVKVHSTNAGDSYLTGITAVDAGYEFSVALKNDGTVWTWGDNYNGQLGDGNYGYNKNKMHSVKVLGLENITAISAGSDYVLALRKDGTVWAWGSNFRGKLGDGTTDNRYTPVPVVSPDGTGYLTRVTAVSAGDGHSIAVRSDGTVWTWGDNYYGTLGMGKDGSGNNITDSLPHPVPQQAAGLSDITAISAGQSHSLALKDDGTVWAWGYNYNYGQLGSGTTVYTNSMPSQVVGTEGLGSTLDDIASIGTGYNHSMAVDTNGHAYIWGNNNDGALGNNDIYENESTIPLLVRKAPGTEPLPDIVFIEGGDSHTLAVRENGDIWSWGDGGSGQLGTNNTDNSYVPVQTLIKMTEAPTVIGNVGEGDKDICGTAEPGSIIRVYYEDIIEGWIQVEEGTADIFSKYYQVKLTEGTPYEGDRLKVTAQAPGKTESDGYEFTVTEALPSGFIDGGVTFIDEHEYPEKMDYQHYTPDYKLYTVTAYTESIVLQPGFKDGNTVTVTLNANEIAYDELHYGYPLILNEGLNILMVTAEEEGKPERAVTFLIERRHPLEITTIGLTPNKELLQPASLTTSGLNPNMEFSSITTEGLEPATHIYLEGFDTQVLFILGSEEFVIDKNMLCTVFDGNGDIDTVYEAVYNAIGANDLKLGNVVDISKVLIADHEELKICGKEEGQDIEFVIDYDSAYPNDKAAISEAFGFDASNSYGPGGINENTRLEIEVDGNRFYISAEKIYNAFGAGKRTDDIISLFEEAFYPSDYLMYYANIYEVDSGGNQEVCISLNPEYSNIVFRIIADEDPGDIYVIEKLFGINNGTTSTKLELLDENTYASFIIDGHSYNMNRDELANAFHAGSDINSIMDEILSTYGMDDSNLEYRADVIANSGELRIVSKCRDTVPCIFFSVHDESGGADTALLEEVFGLDSRDMISVTKKSDLEDRIENNVNVAVNEWEQSVWINYIEDPISIYELLESLEADMGSGTLSVVDENGNPVPYEIDGEPIYKSDYVYLRATSEDGSVYIDLRIIDSAH